MLGRGPSSPAASASTSSRRRARARAARASALGFDRRRGRARHHHDRRRQHGRTRSARSRSSRARIRATLHADAVRRRRAAVRHAARARARDPTDRRARRTPATSPPGACSAPTSSQTAVADADHAALDDAAIADGNDLLAELFAELAGAGATGGERDARGRARHALRRPGAHADRSPCPATAGASPRTPTGSATRSLRDYDRTFGHTIDEEVEIVSLRATIAHRSCRAGPLSSRPRRARPPRRRHGRGVVVHARRAAAVRASSTAQRSASTRARTARRSCSRRRRRRTSTPASRGRLDAGGIARDRDTREADDASREPVVYRAGLGARAAVPRTPIPITTEVIRHGLNSAAEADEAGADPHVVLARSSTRCSTSRPSLYDRAVRLLAQAPSLPFFMGTMSFCIEAAVEAVGGEDGARPGRHHPLQRPVRHRLAPAGRRGRDAGVPARRRARSATRRSRRTGSTSARKEPYCTDTIDVFQEGTIFPGVKLYRRGELVDGHLPHGARELARAEDGRRRHQRRGRRRAHRRPPRSSGSCERYGLEALPRVASSGCTTTARRSCAATSSSCRTAATSATARWTTTASRDEPIPFEVMRRGRRLDRAASTSRTRPTRRPGPVNCPLAVDRLGEPRRDDDARRRRRGAERGPLPPDRGRHAAGLDVPPAAAVAVLPLRLAGDAGDRGDLQRGRRGDAGGGLRVLSGGDICAARLVGRPRGDGRALGRRLAASGRPGRHRSHGDGASSLPAPRRGGDALRAARGVGGEEPVADGALSSSRRTRAGPGAHRGGLGLDMAFRILEDAYATSTIERTKNAPWGLEGGGEARPNAGELRLPDGTREAVREGDRAARSRRDPRSSFHCGGGGGYGPPSERDPGGGARRPARGLHHRGARAPALPARVRVVTVAARSRRTSSPAPAAGARPAPSTPIRSRPR